MYEIVIERRAERDLKKLPEEACRLTVRPIQGLFPAGILRRRFRAGRSIRYLLPRAVECYLEAQGLYCDAHSK